MSPSTTPPTAMSEPWNVHAHAVLCHVRSLAGAALHTAQCPRCRGALAAAELLSVPDAADVAVPPHLLASVLAVVADEPLGATVADEPLPAVVAGSRTVGATAGVRWGHVVAAAAAAGAAVAAGVVMSRRPRCAVA